MNTTSKLSQSYIYYWQNLTGPDKINLEKICSQMYCIYACSSSSASEQLCLMTWSDHICTAISYVTTFAIIVSKGYVSMRYTNIQISGTIFKISIGHPWYSASQLWQELFMLLAAFWRSHSQSIQLMQLNITHATQCRSHNSSNSIRYNELYLT